MVKNIARNFKRIDKLLLFASICMFIFGLLMIFSASYVSAIDFNDNAFYYLKKQGVALLGCLMTFLVVVNIPSKFYKKNYIVIIIASILLLYLLFYFGITINGATSWYRIGGFGLQPSEFVKIGVILFLATYYDKFKNNKDSIIHFVVPLLPILIIFILIYKQPDLGTDIILCLISFFMIVKVPKYPKINKLFVKTSCTLIIILLLSVIFILVNGTNFFYDYQLSRLNFLNPCQRYTEVGTGYQVCNAYIAINNGGLFGSGFGNSTQKYLYLPESHTDAIFPVIVEECGLLVGLVLLIIYVLIIFRIFKIANKSNSLYGGLVCYGVAAYMFLHIIINLGGIFGLLPLTGVPLPFLSYGGSYALSLTIALSIVQRINIENKISNDEEKIKNKIREL